MAQHLRALAVQTGRPQFKSQQPPKKLAVVALCPQQALRQRTSGWSLQAASLGPGAGLCVHVCAEILTHNDKTALRTRNAKL